MTHAAVDAHNYLFYYVNLVGAQDVKTSTHNAYEVS